MVHLGLGAFHRAHQAWYTQAAGTGPAGPVGIAAFTGRRPDAARPLIEQDGLYTLLVRGPDGDRAELITCLSAALDGADAAAWRRQLADPAVGVLTLTVTEAGYRRGPGGRLDTADPQVAADLQLLRAGADGAARTAPGRIVQGLAARRAAGGAPLAVVPCDNLVGNGEVARRVVLELAELADPALAGWAAGAVSFVNTVVDRITPATTAEALAAAAAAGWPDQAPVVTEPFTEWVLAGQFPAGRPAWEAGGARFVADVAPYARRKLWLLNGAHSLLAYAAPARGHATVAEAVADPECAGWVEQWWAEAGPPLGLPAAELDAYRRQLADRFANPRIRHELAQIAMDGSQKLPVRVLPVLRGERAAGRMPEGAVRVVAGWLWHLRGGGAPVRDPRAAELVPAAAGEPAGAAARVLGALDPELAGDGELARAVAGGLAELAGARSGRRGRNGG